MKKRWFNSALTIIMAAIVAITFASSDAFARGGRSGGGFSRSSSSRSFSRSSSRSSRSSSGLGSSRKTTASKPKPKTPAQIKADKARAAKVAQQNKIRNQTNKDAKSFKSMDTKSPKYTKTDKMLQKNIGKSGKTFKTRDAAKADMTSKMASKKYTHKDSKTAMANRPDYVPATRNVGGVTYNTTYVGGQYGYMGPSGSFIAYLAADMIVTDMMLHSYGYRPTYVATAGATGTSGMGRGLAIVFGIIGVVLIGAIIIAIASDI